MAKNEQKIGWIGMGRMGSPMAERLLKAGYDVSIWNRTRSKAEPLAAKGGKVVDKLADLAGVDVLFSIVSTGKDLKEVYFAKDGGVDFRQCQGDQGRAPLVGDLGRRGRLQDRAAANGGDRARRRLLCGRGRA